MRLMAMWTVAVLTALFPSIAGGTPSQHTISVKFNYDFTYAKGCKEKETGRCVKRFVIYDVTDPNKPVRLFSIAVPAKVKKIVYQIKGRSPMLNLTDGVHTLAAVAQWADGTESDKNACKVTVTVGGQGNANADMGSQKQGGDAKH
jgi:hypothetical protein